jgi:hypothetical protein
MTVDEKRIAEALRASGIEENVVEMVSHEFINTEGEAHNRSPVSQRETETFETPSNAPSCSCGQHSCHDRTIRGDSLLSRAHV